MGLRVNGTAGPDPISMDASGLIVIERLTGALSMVKLQELVAKLADRWTPNVSIRLLVDLTDATTAGVGWDGLFEFAAHVDQVGLHARIPRVAIVASRDDIVALARLYKSLVQHDDRLAVFGETGQALEWLRAMDAEGARAEYRVAGAEIRVLPRR